MYDLIIIWGWASGLFCSINASKESKKLIIEKQWNLGKKILLSWWWRCNFTNLNIDSDRYFGQNKKMLASVFHKYTNTDFMEYLDINWIEYKIEDNGRVLLKSGKANELLEFLIKASKENWTEIKQNQEISKIKKTENWFTISTQDNEFECKNLVIATWWISYPQVWTTWFGLEIAKQFWIQTIPCLPALCGLETENWFSEISWSSIVWLVQVYHWDKKIYETKWNILFTHRWLSWPAIFNCSAWIAEYLTKSSLNQEIYQQKNAPSLSKKGVGGDFKIKITPDQITKKLGYFIKNSPSFSKKGLEDDFSTQITNFRPLEESKVSSGGVSMNEIKPNFECKNIPNLFFIWESLDIIWETWWFNLQRAWSSGAICGQNF